MSALLYLGKAITGASRKTAPTAPSRQMAPAVIAGRRAGLVNWSTAKRYSSNLLAGSLTGGQARSHCAGDPIVSSSHKLQYLVVGTGRSGTVYLARLLTSIKIPCGHERVFNGEDIDAALAILEQGGSNSWCSQVCGLESE